MKKKKKKKKAAFDLEEFEKELGEQRDSDNPEDEGENPFAPEKEEEQASGKSEDVEAWQGTDRDYTYQELLGRIFRTLRLQNPALSGEKKKYTMVPPVVQRDGSKKTVFANVLEICKRMHRQPDHVIQYLFTELGTVGSVDGSQRLVIRGRFQPKQIENVLRRYIGTCVSDRSGVRHLQDVPFAQHAPHKREPYLFHDLRGMRLSALGQRDQDRFPGADRQAQQDAPAVMDASVLCIQMPWVSLFTLAL